WSLPEPQPRSDLFLRAPTPSKDDTKRRNGPRNVALASSGEVLFQRYPADFTLEAELRVDRYHRRIIGCVPCLHLLVPVPPSEIYDSQLQRDCYSSSTIFTPNARVSLNEASRLPIDSPDGAESNVLGTILRYNVALRQEIRILELERLPLLIRGRRERCYTWHISRDNLDKLVKLLQ